MFSHLYERSVVVDSWSRLHYVGEVVLCCAMFLLRKDVW
jgi:hypothetical protein